MRTDFPKSPIKACAFTSFRAHVLVTHDRFCRRHGWGREPLLHPDQPLYHHSAATLHTSWHRTYSLHHRPQGTSKSRSGLHGRRRWIVQQSHVHSKESRLGFWLHLYLLLIIEKVCLCVCVKFALWRSRERLSNNLCLSACLSD